MSLLSPSALAAFARQVAPLLGTHCRTQPDEEQEGAVRIVDDDGRALVLYQDASKPQRLFITVLLPRAAEVAGIVLKPVTVAVGSTPGHAATHIRRRLLPAHAAALAEFTAAPAPPSPQSDQGSGLRLGDVAAPTALEQHAARALTAVVPPFSPHRGGGWVIGERLNRRRPLVT
ncbi:hypothetical protein ACFWXK_10210 [Streptomyces sp. NPDC059070]|uniref:hypothetical protein n=1 Tax=Streptomyces sp. NPDC059070 TaxID=3346713 RepID=UPI00369FC626